MSGGDPVGGASVVIVADNDEPGRRHALRVHADLVSAGVRARIVLPRSGKGAADHLAAGHGLDEFVAFTPDDDPGAGGSTPPAVPSEPVDGARLLQDLAELFRRFMVLDDHERVALALWVVHTHAIDAVNITPYIAITSAEKRSGKTKLLELQSRLVRRPWMTGRVTAAVLARKIQADQPTLLFDEGDATFGRGNELGEALRGILNSGFRRDGKVSLNVPAGKSGWEPVDLGTFCAKAIAGIGLLPDTVMDRSIRIELRRKLKHEQVERLRDRLIEPICGPLREAAAAWAAQNMAALTGAEPALPDELDDRAQDISEPLLAIADLAGGEWPRLAREAAIELCRSREEDEPSNGVKLLRDIRRVFDANEDADRLPSGNVIQELAQFDDAPWGNWYGRTITPQAISKILKPFGIKTREIWFNNEKHRGWLRAQFTDAWARYLPENPVGPVDGVEAPSEAPPTTPTALTIPAPTKVDVDAFGPEDLSWTFAQVFPGDEPPLPDEQRRLLRKAQGYGLEIPRRQDGHA